ncbi:protein FAR-RED IMPAIRED RESPONSE 1-like [Spinacia oleracea]|uniref:Protein FAR-RED IMPAIRED RESPONSE 1-like n=1 Tax=Spinacia oleracea TaxID=3562 RepID=A0ABM3R8C3_SPIOL|nr:protein FAR-RED IMPAIRED RESPONSE 1-like [Spinacia oleracea]
MENLIRSMIQSTQRIQVPVEPDIQDATMEEILNNCIENNALAQEREEEEATNEIEAEEQHIIYDSEVMNNYALEKLIIQPDQDIVGTLMGYTAETVEELLGFYEKHASAVGFSIRKGNTRFKVGTRIVLEKTFLCSTAGVTNNGKKKKKKVQTVVPVVPKKERKPRFVIHDFFNYMEIEAGGEENLGQSKKDHLKYCTRLKMKQIKGGGAQAVTDIMYLELEGDPNFFFRFRLDEKGKLRSLFWRDCMMMEDYRIFGDIVVFDTTYRTNMYNLICAPIVGINNHWNNCMFGCAFIGDKKIESFVWLLQTFKKSMGGKSPISIFTDQDAAMNNAINQVFPYSRHRLCVWHLHQNAITRFGALKRDLTFKKTFNYCLYKCVTVVEFETNWRSMLQIELYYVRKLQIEHRHY